MGGDPQLSPNPQLDSRAPCQFQLDLGDLGDAQLRQLMEDLCQQGVLRKSNVSPRDPPSGHWRLQQETGTQIWITRRSPSREGGDGNPEDNHLDPLPPLTRWRHRASHKYTSHQIVTWYPMLKHFQQWSHAREYRSVFEQWYHEVQNVKDHYL